MFLFFSLPDGMSSESAEEEVLQSSGLTTATARYIRGI